MTDIWNTLDDMTTARKNIAAAAIDGKIYAAGGVDVHDQLVNVLEMTL